MTQLVAIGNRVGPRGAPALCISLIIALCSGGTTLLAALLWLLFHSGRLGSQLPVPADAYLVPGKRLLQGRIDADFRQRLLQVAALWQIQPAPVVLSGGVTDGSGISEAHAGRDVLLQQGVTADHILLEEQAQHSFENLLYSKALMASTAGFDPATIALISSRYHLPRLCLMAKELGLTIYPVAAAAATPFGLRRLRRLLMEAFYIHWYCTARVIRML